MGENFSIQEYYDGWENQSYLATLFSGVALVAIFVSLLNCAGEGLIPQFFYVVCLGAASLSLLLSYLLLWSAKEATTFIALEESHREATEDIKRNIKYSVITNAVTIVLIVVDLVVLCEKLSV